MRVRERLSARIKYAYLNAGFVIQVGTYTLLFLPNGDQKQLTTNLQNVFCSIQLSNQKFLRITFFLYLLQQVGSQRDSEKLKEKKHTDDNPNLIQSVLKSHCSIVDRLLNQNVGETSSDFCFAMEAHQVGMSTPGWETPEDWGRQDCLGKGGT